MLTPPADLLPHVTGHVAERIGPHAWLRFLEVFLRSPVLEPGRIGVPVTVAVGADRAEAQRVRLHAVTRTRSAWPTS
mgnify:CR=1 FL=1